MKASVLIAAAGLALGGCATLDMDLGSSGRQVLRNAEGHVTGYKEMLRNKKTGEVFAQVHAFTPIRNDVGDVIGYEEESRGGAIVRDLQGRPIGNRYTDMRSRSTNVRNRGITIVIGSLDRRRVVAEIDRPHLNQLMASLSAADLNALR